MFHFPKGTVVVVAEWLGFWTTDQKVVSVTPDTSKLAP